MGLESNAILEITGIVIEVIGGLVAIGIKIPILSMLIEWRFPIKQINAGLDKLIHKTLDERPQDVQLRKEDEGFNEILSIINKSYGPYEDIQLMVFQVTSAQRSVGVSSWDLILAGKNGESYYPLSKRDLLFRIDVGKERYLVRLGFKILLLGVIIQISGLFI